MKYDTHKGEMAVKEVDQEDGLHLLSPTPSPSITPSVIRVSPCHYIIIISIPKLYSIPVPCPINHTSNHTPSSLPTPAPPGEILWLCLCSYHHCITLLKALTFQTSTRRLLVQEKLIRELVEVNLRSGSPQMQRDIWKLLCQLTRWVDPGVWLFLFSEISFGL